MATTVPRLNVPSSSNTVSVRIIDLTTIAKIHVDRMYSPSIPGLDYLDPAPSFSFLIEHDSGSKLLFDLGIPKNLEALGPEVVARCKQANYEIDVKRDVADELERHGIKRDGINAVIWSHTHWDHKGDVSTFPSSTDLVVGPGAKKAFIEGDGNSAIGGILPRDREGRTVREPDFSGSSTLKIGQFRAFDYFSDGSFYLLDTPGHSIGHLCGLARTTPDTFIFMGGDATHHCAEYRPSKYLPMPESISPNPVNLQQRHIPYCPGTFFEDLNEKRGRDPKGPPYQPAWGYNMDKVMETIGHMQEYDGDENVFVILAHDATVKATGALPVFPEKANDWKEKGLAQDVKWSWVGDILRNLKS